jgi:ABC-type transport system involved in cytochrome bd biosynthesis fused ATPase/permease subunit
VAHRLSTIINADQIYVLEEGRVIEEGTHAELISKNGSFSRMHLIARTREERGRRKEITKMMREVRERMKERRGR